MVNEYTRNYYNRYRNFNFHRLNNFIIGALKRLFKTNTSFRVNVSIDIGSGMGKLIYRLKDFSEVAVGLDISSDALEMANRNNGGCFFILGNGLNLPLKDNICDICTCVNMLEHINGFDLLLKEIHRIMTFNGKVIFVTRNKRYTKFSPSFLRDKTHVREFTPNELEALISRYFCIIETTPFSMFTSFGFFNPILNTLLKPDILISALKK